MSLILEYMFKNKKVALVGNAQSLLSQQKGTDIDSHDIVCRINLGPNLCGTESHGNKTDVLFFSMPEWATADDKLPSDVTKIHTGHCFNPCFMTGEERQNFTPSVKTDYFFPEEKFNLLKKQIGYTRHKTWPSTGATAFYMCLEANPAELNLYGFDFKKTFTFYHNDKTGDPKTSRDKKHKHDWDLEKDWTVKLINQKTNLRLM
jgi:hypothetical protein